VDAGAVCYPLCRYGAWVMIACGPTARQPAFCLLLATSPRSGSWLLSDYLSADFPFEQFAGAFAGQIVVEHHEFGHFVAKLVRTWLSTQHSVALCLVG